ncbi:MAG: galactokinase [Actinomycetia bacterium]|nr:galactokinase [Actinomycetes bacterium]MCP4959862.1 galactokinase [Actinomycetes bacterium]
MNQGPRSAERAVAIFRNTWGEPDFVSRAPGRVNLIGEHTDYNQGFAMPMALPFDTSVAVAPAPRGTPTEIVSENFGGAVLAPYESDLEPGDWAIHIRGVHKLLSEAGIIVDPWRAAIATDVPVGASLSSSAALEVACTLAILHMAATRWSPVAVAQLGQRVENEIVGLPSGIMDQLISTVGVRDHAVLIDCRSLELSPRPLPAGVVVAVMDTNTRRELVDSEYADRRTACERAAAALGVESLRDATLDDLVRLGSEFDLERRRARHVIGENRRTVEAAKAMTDGNAVLLGELMTQSHNSLRDDFEVSSPALDHMVDIAHNSPGCLGARMTGGGFAGCAVALVESERAAEFSVSVTDRYGASGERTATVWICEAGSGGSVLTTTQDRRPTPDR